MRLDEYPNSQEVRQAIFNVIPEFGFGDHTVARLLGGNVRFARNDERLPTNILRAFGELKHEASFDLRMLHINKPPQKPNLDIEIVPFALKRRIFFSWNGQAVNDDGRYGVYGNLVDEVDFRFDFNNNMFRIRSTSKGEYQHNFPFDADGHAMQEDPFRTKSGYLLLDPKITPNTVEISIQSPDASEPLRMVIPAFIHHIDLNALPQPA